MVNNNLIVRRQRVSALALISAVGTFSIGILLPWNLRSDQAEVTHTVSSSLGTVVGENPPSPNLAQQSQIASSVKPETSKPSTSSQTPETSPNTPAKANLSESSPQSAVQQKPLEIPAVGEAIAQRVEDVKTAAVRLRERRYDNTIPDRFKGRTIKEINLTTDEKVIALTFDDGPWPKITEQVLDILRENNIKATFFWVGQALNNHKEIGQKVAAEGHVIANHTWNHRYHKVSQATAAREIESTADLIKELTGIETTIFRPPGGVEDNGLVDYVHKKDYINVMWSSDSKDWYASANSIKNNVLKSAKPGRIVLLHDGGGNRIETVKALPEIIAELKKQGYRFVTIPELLEMADREMAQYESQKK